MPLQQLEQLKKFMPPITPPPDHIVDWAMAEDVFGIRFPNDFKQFVHTYGNVIWCDLFRAIYPETGSRKQCEASRAYVQEILGYFADDRLRDTTGKIVEIPPYPAPGGLLPCLADTNSDFICWVTRGEPDEWTTVRLSMGIVVSYECNLTQLICDWIEQKPPADQAWGSFFLTPKKYGIHR